MLGETSMMRHWVGAAVIAGCLGLAPAARAQSGPPPEPIPVCPEPGPNYVPGPLSTSTAPPGPSDCLSLPDDGTGAFPCKCPEPEEACYFSVGAQMLQRQHLASGGVLAVQDPGKLDTGNPPPADAPVLQSLSDVNPHFNAGPAPPSATFSTATRPSKLADTTSSKIISPAPSRIRAGSIPSSAIRRSVSRATTACGCRPTARAPRSPRPCGPWKPITATPTRLSPGPN